MSLGVPRSAGPGSPWTWPPADCITVPSAQFGEGTPLERWYCAIEFNETDPDTY